MGIQKLFTKQRGSVMMAVKNSLVPQNFVNAPIRPSLRNGAVFFDCQLACRSILVAYKKELTIPQDCCIINNGKKKNAGGA